MVHLVYCDAKISATATVKSVQNHVKLTENQMNEILENNQDKLNLSKKQQDRWRKKCMCLVEFEDVKEIEPLEFDHQGNMDDLLIFAWKKFIEGFMLQSL